MAATHHVVVDGSNLATEGRSAPSLAQLDAAVRAYLAEDPTAEVVVVVDASFSHRIDPSEREALDAAERHGELVAPPAGAIGRGDAFVLRIAERTGAVVLSNDSFQEFHDEHPWLFDEGRLVGGKPVPGVGWIFTPRRPVRGPRSQKKERAEESGDELSAPRKAAELAKALKKAAKATKGAVDRAAGKKAAGMAKAAKKAADAKGKKKEQKSEPAKTREKADRRPRTDVAKGVKAAARPKVEKAPPKKAVEPQAPTPTKRVKKVSLPAAATKPAKKARKAGKKEAEAPAPAKRRVGVKAAIHQATAEVLAPPDPAATDGSKPTGRRRRRSGPPPAVNEPLAFITFVAEHPVGSTFDGVVASFTSHGAMVDVSLADGSALHCYAPLTGLGEPPPRAARDVLRRGEERRFALVALDPPRRMAELALPEFAASDNDRRRAGEAG